MTKLLKFGFEIEGEWNGDTLSFLSEQGGRTHGDGSIRMCPSMEHHSKRTGDNVSTDAEYNSPVYGIEEIATAEAFFDGLQDRFEKGNYHWNKSMGFHVHVSFDPKRPPEMLSKEFTEFFRKQLTKKLPGILKSRGQNSFCKSGEYMDQEIYRPRDRYRMVNYASLDKHGTIEFRIFPSEEPKKMWKYLSFTLDTVQEFLETPLERLHEFDPLGLAEDAEPLSKDIDSRLNMRDMALHQGRYFNAEFENLYDMGGRKGREAIGNAVVDFAGHAMHFRQVAALGVSKEVRYHAVEGKVEKHSPMTLS